MAAKTIISIAVSAGAIACGAALVIIADRQGWLPSGGLTAPISSGATAPPTRSIIPPPRAAASDSNAPTVQLVSSPEPRRSLRVPSVTCTTEDLLIQFADGSVAHRVGITTASVQRREITRTLECNAELLFNGDRFSHISPRASGVVQRVEKRLGDLVEAGEVLAVIDSADLGNAKAELLQAQAAVNLWQQNYDRQRQLTESGIAAQRELLDAQTRLTEANIALSRAAQRLRNLGVAADRIDEIKQSGETTSLLPVTAPFGGIVVDRHAVQGEVVDSNHVLFSIADTSLVWAMLDVYEPDVFAVALGQPVTLHLSGLPGQPVAGRITWISPQLDPQTRTLKVRAEVENSDGRLRANMFGRATIVVRDREPMLVVPREALQWEGCCNVVFVQRSESEFQPRKVRVGHEVNGWSVIEEGLEPDEAVVVQGSFLLKTEILKANIGAGCCAED